MLTIGKLSVKSSVLGLLILVLFESCSSKEGCLDPVATNYSSSAEKDNSTCNYPGVEIFPSELSKLNNDFNETSGLDFVDQKLWTLTDAGGENKIYSIQFATGNSLEEIELEDVENIDFEALSFYNNHFYVGDFGNNEGDREDLVIHKFPTPVTINPTNSTETERIEFFYPEQDDFDDNPLTPYDAEAMVVYKDNIYVFTKNHQNQTTSLYEVPDVPGRHAARLLGTFDSNGLITDAAVSDDGQTLALIGHDGINGFIWVMFNFENHFFSGRKVRVDIGPVSEVGQVEGITFFKENQLFISNEKNSDVKPRISFLDINQIHE